MSKRLVFALITLATAFLACSEGDFDQRMRADVDELVDGALIFVNTNPGHGSGLIRGEIQTGGPVTFARVTAHAVDFDGVVDFDENTALGNSVSGGLNGEFNITLRRDYEGPIIISARPTEFNGQPTRYPSPANSAESKTYDLRNGEELLGYVIDYPFIEDAVAVTPLSTLVVEKAIQLGGVSSANLAIAARQVGGFFGLFDARMRKTDNIVDDATIFIGTLEEDMVFALLSHYAKQVGVRDAALWSALRRDIRDDGEINGTAGLIDGSEATLADFSQPNFMGQSVLVPFLSPANQNNKTGVNAGHLVVSDPLIAVVSELDQAHSLAQTTMTIDSAVVLHPTIHLKAGQTTSLGVRAFESINDDFYLVVSSDGPNSAQYDVSATNPAIVTFPAKGFVSVPLGVAAGSSTQIMVRVRPDGLILTGTFDQTLTITLEVIP